MARPATSLAAARGSTCPRVAPTLFCDAVSRSRVAGLARHRFLVRSTARSVAPDGPPASFQPRELTGGTSAAVVARRYPELADLVEVGAWPPSKLSLMRTHLPAIMHIIARGRACACGGRACEPRIMSGKDMPSK